MHATATRSTTPLRTVVGIALALAVAVGVDRWVLPLSDVPVLYAIPSLLAARRLSPRAVLATAAASLLLFVGNSLTTPMTAYGAWPLGAAALLIVGYLAYRLAGQRRETARRAEEAASGSAALRVRAGQQATVAALGQAALASRDVDSILEDAARRVAEVMGTRFAAIFALLPGDEQLSLRVGVGLSPELVGRAIPRGGSSCLLDAALRSNDPTLASDLASNPRYSGPALLREQGAVGGASVAIQGSERSYGVLAAFSDAPRDFAADDVSFLQTVANVLGATVDRLQAEQDRSRLLEREQAARAEAERAVRGRDEFLSVAAHELKTPVTSLRGFAQLAVRQLDATGQIEPPLARQALDVIDRQSDRLTTLVARLLDISRIEAGRLALEPRPSDLTGLVAAVLDGARARTTRHEIELDAPGPVIIPADQTRLEQVLTNLVENAIKYSPEGGPISVTVRERAELVEIAVRDCGLGIPPEHRARVFDRYYQAHQLSQGGGMGLGLYVSRQIVELHGGELRAEFPEDGGTRFVLTLPRG